MCAIDDAFEEYWGDDAPETTLNLKTPHVGTLPTTPEGIVALVGEDEFFVRFEKANDGGPREMIAHGNPSIRGSAVSVREKDPDQYRTFVPDRVHELIVRDTRYLPNGTSNH